jgi:multicomponent Na+:H+ antiporter subunit G
MNMVLDMASWICLGIGGGFCVVGAVGMLRMPDFFTRLHAASVIETLGAGPILLGLLIQAGFTLNAVKIVMIGLLIFFTGPTATHALAKAGLERGLRALAVKKGA